MVDRAVNYTQLSKSRNLKKVHIADFGLTTTVSQFSKKKMSGKNKNKYSKFQSNFDKIGNLLLLLPTLIPLSGVGTTCFHHVVIKIRHLFLRLATCLTSTLLETGVDAND
jgi:hypothetical protein